MSTETETPPRESPEAVSEPSKKSKKRKNDADEIEVDLSLPEPPSKKAKRLLKKGKPLPVKKDSDDEASDKEEGGDGDKKDKDGKKKERSPYGVWIGNLRFSVTKHDLRDWLLENSGGSITAEHITRIKLPSSRPKGGARRAEGEAFENKGYAYVDFSTYDATIAAIALSETEWHRRRLLIKDAKSFEGRPAKPKADADEAGAGEAGGKAAAAAAEASAAPKSTTKKIFVGNLSFQTTEDDLHELFGTCGEIEWLKVAQFEDSGKCKGYAWVKFKEAEAADWAVKGFVKIKEVEETEEDFMDVDDEEQEGEETKEEGGEGKEEDDDDDESEKKKKTTKKTKPQKEERKVKTRKWWVNTLHGRRLKIEAAEDDQTRYKKRYGGKGAAAAAGGQKENSKREAGGDRQRPQTHNHRHNNIKKRRDHDEGGERNTDANAAAPKEAEVSNFRQDISVARLTGAPVKPEGKKITFE
ncbi:rna-binding protein rnp24-like protein [Diaporthe amygdali]|uniref:rna-binding protein rnp24-like protein n=1 Tax=Phomopsis amygdali TaxID=1214568 RepID=UPI0022FEF33E|nr:rna-binding protein rnp24-like protein [Diaporthe amygdali]KAJ0119320.1 rna-binding protein rnp24-like protein [Diaporthe amygdali]